MLEEYSAIEWVAKERNLPLAADANANPRDRSWTPDNAPDMRRMLEREMATSDGYADGKRHAETRINMSTRDRSARSNAIYQTGTEQTALMDRDVSAFRSLFQGEAKRDALVMLDQSTIAIDTVLHRYGLPGGSFRMKTAAQHVAHDPGALDAETEKWVSLATRADDHQAAFAHGHDDRESLAREADKLRGLQASIEALHREQLRLIPLAQHARHEHPEGRQQPKQPDMTPPPTFVGHQAPATGAPPPFKSVSMSSHDGPPAQQLEDVRASLEVRRLQFQAAWIQAERKHPIFAAYRGGKGADATKLAGLGGNDETVTRSVIKQVLPKLGNIYRTKAALEGAWGTLDPLRLAPVVEITKQRLFVPQGSPRERAVHDMVEHAHDGHGGLVQWALEA